MILLDHGITRLVVACALLAAVGSAEAQPLQAGPYLGQNPPGTTPVIFAPGVISKGNIHSRLEISPDGQEMIWSAVDMKTFSTRILSVKNAGGRWSAPQPPPFARDGNTQGALFSPDGKRLFFSVDTGAGWARKYVEKTEAGLGRQENPRPIPARLVEPGPLAEGSSSVAALRPRLSHALEMAERSTAGAPSIWPSGTRTPRRSRERPRG